MKRVLVTGATGFVGRPTLAQLLGRGFEVHVVGRTPLKDQRIFFHPANLSDRDMVRSLLLRIRPTHLLHLAWDVTPGRYWQAPGNLTWVGISLDLVLDFAASGGKRLVCSGTCAEYKWGATRFNEFKTPCEPASLYGTSKDALWRLIHRYSSIAGISAAWGRLFFLYGPGEKPGRLVTDAIRSLINAELLPTTDGRQMRDFLHVEDAAAALTALLDCNVRGPVNIGSGSAVAVRTCLDTLAMALGNNHCLLYGKRSLSQDEPPIIEADITRLTEEVGFAPRYNLTDGLAHTVASFRV